MISNLTCVLNFPHDNKSNMKKLDDVFTN